MKYVEFLDSGKRLKLSKSSKSVGCLTSKNENKITSNVREQVINV